jgi:hypothetical protein
MSFNILNPNICFNDLNFNQEHRFNNLNDSNLENETQLQFLWWTSQRNRRPHFDLLAQQKNKNIKNIQQNLHCINHNLINVGLQIADIKIVPIQQENPNELITTKWVSEHLFQDNFTNKNETIDQILYWKESNFISNKAYNELQRIEGLTIPEFKKIQKRIGELNNMLFDI